MVEKKAQAVVNLLNLDDVIVIQNQDQLVCELGDIVYQADHHRLHAARLRRADDLACFVTYFLIDGLSLSAELNVLYIDQTTQPGLDPAEDGWGVHFALLARWHFVSGDSWSLYLDGGAGILGSTVRTPGPGPDDARGGSYLNFTPQVGGGFTYEFQPQARLMIGCRWFHISNARTSDNNPGSDSLLFYAGVMFPF